MGTALRHKVCPVESRDTGSVGLGNFGTIELLFTVAYCTSCMELCCWEHFLDSHIFTIGLRSCCSRCESSAPSMVSVEWSSGAFKSPPDLTPFTLDKHNTKEKRKFHVRGWVTTCRQTDSLILLGDPPLINHQAMKISSPNRGLKQTEHGAPQLHLFLIPHTLLPFFSRRNFYEEKERCSGAGLHMSKEVNTTTSMLCTDPKLREIKHYFKGFYRSSSHNSRTATNPNLVTANIFRPKERSSVFVVLCLFFR